MRTNNPVYTIVFLAGVIVSVSIMIAGVNAITSPVIVEREKIAAERATSNALLRSYLVSVFPGATAFVNEYSTVFHDSAASCVKVLNGATVLGYGVDAFGRGYQSIIRAAVVTGPDGVVKSVGIISQAETEYLGTRILDSAFLSQFCGMGINEMRVRLPGDTLPGIDAIAASTVTTRALVEDAIKTALVYLHAHAL